MNEDQFKPQIRAWYESNNFVVTDIPCEAGKKTPDLRLGKLAESYLLELKIKGDDPDELARDSKILADGHLLERSVPLIARNRLDAIVRDGHDQMMEFDPALDSFHVLWIHCFGRDAHLLEERFRITLFGQQRLISTEREEVLHALFFNNSSFWRYRKGLDGVMLSVGAEAKLCINTHSERVDTFRKSELFNLHQGGLCDPELLCHEDSVLLVDGDVDRRDENAVLAFLRQKYSFEHLQTFVMGAHSVATHS
jgi:hypothetical protein